MYIVVAMFKSYKKDICETQLHKWAGPSEKGAYGFSNIMRANDVDDVIYDVTIGNIQYATQTFL